MLNVSSFTHLFRCRLFYDVFWHMLGFQSCCPIVHRPYMKCVWDGNNKRCQSLHGGKGSFLSSQPPQMLSLCLLMPLNDSNIQIFIQVSDSRCSACVSSCMQAKLNVYIWYDEEPESDRSPLLRLLRFSSGIQVHLQEENCLRMCPTQLKNH